MEVQKYNVWWIRQMKENFQPSCNSFRLVIKKHAVLCYPDGRLCIFCWLILDAFHRELLLVGLMGEVFIGINYLVFLKELIIEDSIAIPPYTQHHLLWMKTALVFCWWWFISFASQSLPFHIIAQYSLLITCHYLFEKWNIFITFR